VRRSASVADRPRCPYQRDCSSKPDSRSASNGYRALFKLRRSSPSCRRRRRRRRQYPERGARRSASAASMGWKSVRRMRFRSVKTCLRRIQFRPVGSPRTERVERAARIRREGRAPRTVSAPSRELLQDSAVRTYRHSWYMWYQCNPRSMGILRARLNGSFADIPIVLGRRLSVVFTQIKCGDGK